jgi:hypothetical protein
MARRIDPAASGAVDFREMNSLSCPSAPSVANFSVMYREMFRGRSLKRRSG